MDRNKPNKWFPDDVNELLCRARVPNTTSGDLAKHYGVTSSRINQLIKAVGAAPEINALRRQWKADALLEERRTIWRDAFIKHGGNMRLAAREIHVSSDHFKNKFCRAFTKDEILAMLPKRACVICGNRINTRHALQVTCSPGCQATRKNECRRMRAQRMGKTRAMLRYRDYDMLASMLKVHNGNYLEIARILGTTRHAVSSAARGWGLSAIAVEARAQFEEDRFRRAVAMLREGHRLKDIARQLHYSRDFLAAKLRESGLGDLIASYRCYHCGKLFFRGVSQDRMCSDECRHERQKMQNREKSRRVWARKRTEKNRVKSKENQRIDHTKIQKIISRGSHL